MKNIFYVTLTTFSVLIVIGVYFATEIHRVEIVDNVYAVDLSDDATLVGASHNVFIGKVVKKISEQPRRGVPETQYSVEVISNVKGELSGSVIVDQQGGYRDGVLYVIDASNDPKTYMLEPGSTYVLSTRYNELNDWHTLIAYPAARKLVSRDSGATVTSLEEMAETDSRVSELRSAYMRENLLQADHNNEKTYNSYADTPAKNRQAELIHIKEMDKKRTADDSPAVAE